VNGSVLTESELDLSYRHNRYLAEEIAELNDASLQIENGGTEWDAKTKRIKNVGTAVDSTDAVTKVYLDNKVAQVSTGATHPPLKWVFSAISGTNNTYTVTGAEVNGDTAYEVSIDGLIKEPTVEYTVDPNTDTLTIIPNMTGIENIVVIQRGFGVAIAGTVDTNSLEDGSVTNPKLASGAVTTPKLSAGSVTPSKLDTTQTYTALGFTTNGNSFIAQSTHAGGVGIRFHKTDNPSPNGKIDLFVDPDGSLQITAPDKSTGTRSLATLDNNGNLNITGAYKVNGTNLQTVPTGTVSAFAGSAAPTGYALCDGSAVNTHAQSALHAVVSDTYGGDAYVAGVTDQPGATTTFNLPDLSGRVVAGLGGSLLNSTDTLSDTGGTKTVSHTHNLTTTNIVARAQGDQAGVICLNSASVNSSTLNNVQPTIILNYIIKT
jgi:microcystin-dependent protein